MIEGRVSPGLEAIVPVTVRGRHGARRSLRFVIDTGFDGFVCLSGEQVAALDLAAVGSQRVVLGDGREVQLRLFQAVVEWHGELVPVPVLEVEEGALLGMALLRGSRMTLDIVPNGPLRVTPLAEV
jgi:clan AA aspartic protease